jgi:hypothetical protein
LIALSDRFFVRLFSQIFNSFDSNVCSSSILKGAVKERFKYAIQEQFEGKRGSEQFASDRDDARVSGLWK